MVVANAAEEGTELFDVGGHRHFGEGGDPVGVRANANGGNGVSQEVGVGGAKGSLGGGKFEVVFSVALEEGSDVVDVGSRIGGEHDDVVEVGGDAFKVCDDLVDDLDEPPGRGTAALRHDEPLEEPYGRAERGEGDGILVHGDLVERGYEVEQGDDASFSHGIEDLVDVGDELFEGADRVKLLIVGRNPNVAVFLRNHYHRAGVRRDRKLDEASGKVMVEYGVDLFGKNGVDAV